MSQAKILHEFRRHPAVSLVMVIGADRFIEALYQVAATNIPVEDQYYFARTLDDACVIFEQINQQPRALVEQW
jgi:hypothetical protein